MQQIAPGVLTVAPGVWSMGWHKGGEVHAYLVKNSDGSLTLIDTGPDKIAKLIRTALAATGHVARDIKAIAIGHCHASHVTGLLEMKLLSGAPIYASDLEIPIIEGRQPVAKVGRRWPKPFSVRVLALQAGLNAGLGKHAPVTVDERLYAGLKIGDLEYIPLPGHTPGHGGVWHAQHKIMFSIDSISSWPPAHKENPLSAVGWNSFNLDEAEAWRSAEKQAAMQPSIICPGHGDPVTDAAAKLREAVTKR